MDRAAYEAHVARRDALWNVPDDARDAYIEMEDNFCPETVNVFGKALVAAMVKDMVKDIIEEIRT